MDYLANCGIMVLIMIASISATWAIHLFWDLVDGVVGSGSAVSILLLTIIAILVGSAVLTLV